MEIKLTDKQKIIIEGIVRSCIFLVVMRELDFFVLKYITGPIIGFVSICISAIPDYDIPMIPQAFFDVTTIPLILLYFSACFIFNTYVIAKFCGLFKYFFQFKFWKSFLILLIISITLYYFYILNLHTFKLNYEEIGNADSAYSIIPAYLVYLFFNFLTKKFPTPFKQIGYFFSLEFYKDLFKKYRNTKTLATALKIGHKPKL